MFLLILLLVVVATGIGVLLNMGNPPSHPHEGE